MSINSRRVGVVVCVCLLWSAAPAAKAACDTAAPQLTSFTVVPTSVDVTASSQTVRCTFGATDDLSGVASASCSFMYLGATPQTYSCSADTPSSGTRLAGTFLCDVTVPRYAASGLYMASVSLSDEVGNVTSLTFSDLIGRGLPSSISVTSVPDTTPPTVSGFVLSPTSVNTSTSSADVSCTVDLADSPAGVSAMGCVLASPSTNQSHGCAATTPSSGTRQSGTFACSIHIPRYAEAGTWSATLYATDAVANIMARSRAQLEGQGFVASVAVTSDPDTTAPDALTFSISPTTVDVSAAPGSVLCSSRVTDDKSGTNTYSCSFRSPSGLQETTCVSAAPASGTRLDGTFSCSAPLPRYSEGGVWTLTSIMAFDAVGNELDLDATAAAGRGFPTTFTVVCAAAPPEADVTFGSGGSKNTLSWSAVSGALSYTVYRGAASFVDANHDGLPDGGFGTCQVGAGYTQTSYTDATSPAAGSGFFYLVGYKTASGESGLGYTSGGLARVPGSLCP